VTDVFDLDDPTLLFRQDVLEEPVPLYRFLRERAPVWEMPGAATFVVTSERLVAEAASRTGDFSSNLTSVLYRGPDGRPAIFNTVPLGDSIHVLATGDPPVHDRHRKLLQPRLTPARVAWLEAEIAELCDRLLSPVVAAGGGDLMPVFADPFPAVIVNRVIGLDVEDAAEVVRLVLSGTELLAGVIGEDRIQETAEAPGEAFAFFIPRLEAALTQPDDGDTLLGAVAGAVREGSMEYGEALGVLVQLVSAGVETTTSLTGLAVRRLAADQELQQRLRQQPGVIPTFLEEVLRADRPFNFHYRAATRDTSLGGVAIPEGSRVLLMWGAANLDPAAYPDPERFDLERALPKAHLSFGRGIHFCIGAPLARLEGRIAVERLLALTTAVTLDPASPPRFRPNMAIRRLERLPVLMS